MDSSTWIIAALVIGFVAVPAVLQHLWRRRQAERAQALLDIVEGDLRAVPVEHGVRAVKAGRRHTGDERRSTETWFRARLAEAATVKLMRPEACDAPSRVEDPRETTVIAIWGSEALVARVRARQGQIRHLMGQAERCTVTEGTVELVVHGEVDAMGTAATMSDLSDLVRALDG